MLQPPHGPEEPVQPLISVDEAIPDGTVFSYQVGKSIAQLVAVADRRDEFRRDGTVVGVSRDRTRRARPSNTVYSSLRTSMAST